ncbi:MAG: FG-GAP-like repeat-containing protein, partial [Synechococcales bacterium]|nr:FG-GAP-like repeat-containing protein [Synechococcales bacterium]
MPATPNPNNNSFATASDLLKNPTTGAFTGTGLLSAQGDTVDYYKVTLTGSSSGKLELQGLTGNAKLALYKAPASGLPTQNDLIQLPVSNNGTLADSYTSPLNNLTAGTYYIQVDLQENRLPNNTTVNETEAEYALSLFVSTELNATSFLWRGTLPGDNTFTWQMNGTTLAQNRAYAIDPIYSIVGTGDFDGDGTGDVLWRANGGDNTLIIWKTNGVSVIADPKVKDSLGNEVQVGQEWRVIGVKDLDGNGASDALWRSTAGDVVFWSIEDSTITFAGSLTRRDNNWDLVGLEDIDGVAGADALWRNRVTNQLEIETIGRSSRRFTSTVAPSQDYQILGLKDFSGDGKADLLWRNESLNEVYLWRMNGLGNPEATRTIAGVAPSYKVAAVADFNGDNRADILWRNGLIAQTVLWAMTSDGLTFDGNITGEVSDSQGVIPPIGDSFVVLGATDLNSDTRADIVWRDRRDGQVYAWLMNGKTYTEGKALEFNGQALKIPEAYQFTSINYGAYSEVNYLRAQQQRVPQSTAGTSLASAFDVGKLGLRDSTGSYSDSLRSSNPTDFYKFTIDGTPTIFSMDAGNGNQIKLDLFKDSLTNQITYTAGSTLALEQNGTYYIRVSSTGNLTNTATPYTLNLRGDLPIVNLLGVGFTVPASVELPLVDGQAPEEAVIPVTFTVKNEGNIKSADFKVRFYISLDQTIKGDEDLLLG